MRTELKRAFIVLVLVAISGNLAFGDVAATVDVAYPNFSAIVGAGDVIDDGERSIGWRFFVDQEMTITHLGIFDDGDNGLDTTHIVGIWKVKKEGGLELVRQAEIGPGATTDGHHVYVDIDDITLNPDPIPGAGGYERWLIGVWSPSNNADALLIKPREAAQNEPGLIDAEVAGVITIEDYTYRNYQDVDPLPYYYPAPWGETNDWEFHFGVNFKYTTPGPEPMLVDIDIKPGSYPNSVNINGNGVIPVAILGSDGFDVSDVDPESLIFAGLVVNVVGKNKFQVSTDDVAGPDNGPPDGFTDLVIHFADDPDLWVLGDDEEAILLGLWDGTEIMGMDSVRVVP